MGIDSIKANTKNPRIIKDDKFKKLVKSIQEFPEMLEIRPIVVNSDMEVLGGNMRLKACKEAGLKEVYIIEAGELTEEQQKEFIVKDNVGFGEWDWEMLANEWDAEELEDWGLGINLEHIGGSPEIDNAADKFSISEDDYESSQIRQVQLYFSIDEYEEFISLSTEKMSEIGVSDNTSLFMNLLKK